MDPKKEYDWRGIKFSVVFLLAALAWCLYIIGGVFYDLIVLKPKREAKFEAQMAEVTKENEENKKRYEARSKLVNEETAKCLDHGGIPTRGYTDHIICIDRKVLVQDAYEQKEEGEAEASTKK